MTRALVAAVALATFVPNAVAHEGHGNPERYRSLLHYLVEPVHLPMTIAAAVALVLASRWVFDRLPQLAARARRR